MKALGTALQGQDTGAARELYMAMELSDKKWVLALGDEVRAPSRHTVQAGDTGAVLGVIAKAKLRCGLGSQARVHSCYEAGRDGFWLHRWLVGQGIANLVVDAASIEVDRRARRTKTDRTDVINLHRNLLRYHGGERRVWAVARVPTVEQEDARRPLREAERLRHEATAHGNRVQSLLVLHGLRWRKVGGRGWAGWWAQHSGRLLEAMRAEIEREVERLQLVRTQLKMLEDTQRQVMAVQPKAGETPAHAVTRQLCRLGGIGGASAWLLDKEWLGWRKFRNRREVAASVGLTGSPYNSGDSQVEQGISKVGNKRVRWLLVELAWCWLRYQPESELTRWFNARFAHGGKRMRRIGIVALARRLAIALWRYVDQGVVPVGARLKLAAPAA